MGYTHYWSINRNVSQKKYNKALTECRKIIKASTEQFQLANGSGDNGTKPRLTKGLAFNGIEDDAHETFLLEQLPQQNQPEYKSEEDPWIFGFCKTARKPYDAVVVACLLTLKDVLKDDVRISSDGSNDAEWNAAGLRLAEKALDRKVEFSLN